MNTYKKGIAPIIIVILIAVILVGGGLYYANSRQETKPADEAMVQEGDAMMKKENDAMMEKEGDTMMKEDEGAMMQKQKTHMVEMTASGFVPSSLTIKKGDVVQFVNKDTREWWPASALHPTHTVYPGSDIKKCNTAGEVSIFDACGGIAPSASWSFTFTSAGSWGYHDHLRASMRGTIIVE